MNEIEHDDFVLINVLSPEQFNEKHIRTSINVPAANADFVETVEEVAGSKDRKVVVYCASFDCDASPNAARKSGGSRFYAGVRLPGRHPRLVRTKTIAVTRDRPICRRRTYQML